MKNIQLHPVKLFISKHGLLTGIVLVALVARLAYLFLFVGPASYPINFDSIEHHLIAQNLVEGKGYSMYGAPTAYRAPFLSYFMAFGYLIFGQSFAVVRLGMILLSLFLVWGIYLLANEIFDHKTGLWAAFLAAIYPHLIFYSSRIYTELPFTLFSVFATVCFARYFSSQSLRFLGLTAVSLALAILARPVGFVLVGFMLLILLWKQRTQHRLKDATVLSVMVILLLSPWFIRNYQVFDRFVPVTTQGGVVLWVGNNHYMAHHPYYGGGHTLYQYLPGAEQLITDSEIDRSRIAFRYFLNFLQEYPEDIPLLIRKKVLNFWKKEFVTGSSRRWIYEYSYLLVLFFAAGGVILAAIYRRNGLFFLWTLFLANFIPALIFWAGPRIRFPAEPVLIILAAFLLEEIRRRS
ncbi:MAG: phospholipid carrier-dependent glycosyltransferase [Calditrichaeota bacterium]|nr:glycosyltransferase family 39 protein [Calditrichota bacterium]RQW03500.1 MAG: phospholipid carrier-dependent glycosyltransferase [Calditrichota bacterium]